jgi:hydrogenase 3 maturation protease
MPTLVEQLRQLDGRVCLLCVGNTDGGDDAFGVRLAEHLKQRGVPDVVSVETRPEAFLARAGLERFDHVLFIDAVDIGAQPGSVVLLNSSQMKSRFPQVSTHTISLGLLANWTESRGDTRAWLLGAQPLSLKHGAPLTSTLENTLWAIEELLIQRFTPGAN